MLSVVYGFIFSTVQGGSHGWSLPLLPMVCSGPLWAIIITQMCANWSYYTLLTSLPTYMDTVLHFDLRQVRLLKRFSSLTTVSATLRALCMHKCIQIISMNNKHN